MVVTGLFLPAIGWTESSTFDIAGLTVTPHVMADSMRYMRDPEPTVGARVQLFLRHDGASDNAPLIVDAQTRMLFDGKLPAELLAARAWAWHDTPAATPNESLSLPPEALTVWTFNGRSAPFGPGGRARIELGPESAPWLSRDVVFDTPTCWLAAVTFLGPDTAFQPDTVVVHVANGSDTPIELRSCRLWLPRDMKSPRVLFPQPPLEALKTFNGHATVPAGDRGGFLVKTDPLPLTYAAVEVSLVRAGGAPFAIWGHLRIKPERFDISGGWVNDRGNQVARDVFLKALKRLHVNTAHLAITPGYSDTDLYARYPLKYFNALTPVETYDTDAMLPRIHAVEFLGEPQYGGGYPVPPQDVWEKLHPYATTRLATTVTHSDERVWRDYAGLSDFPHYDAYRVTAPSPDAWRKYDRWGKQRIGWGAPLETIGDMCRSLRELNRPMPCAIWSQGPSSGWDVYGGRKRTSPTPDEIRLQAYHAVSTRITSLYWFNLSLKSLVKWRDTLDELGRIGRELRLLDEFLLEGDAYRHARLTRSRGVLDWDVASVCGPRAALLFALDLDYMADPKEKVFRFGAPRRSKWAFPVPAYLRGAVDVFRLDADGIDEVKWSWQDDAIEIRDKASRVAIYIATPDTKLRAYLETKRQQLIATEAALQFDPARDDKDFEQLVQLANSK
jgi:hypothetical protein